MSFEEACKLYTETFAWTQQRWGDLLSFRRLAEIGFKDIASESFDTASFIHSQDDLFFDKETFFEITGGVEGFAQQVANRRIESHKFSIDAASLIFAHTILDKAVLDYCRISALIDPDLWNFAIKDKKIPISELMSSSKEEVFKTKLTNYFDKLDRESLLKKVGFLRKVCRPTSTSYEIKDYVFDINKLKTLDQLRHDVVHGKDVVVALPNNDDDIKYLERTSTYLFSLLHETFDVKMDPRNFLQTTNQKPNPSTPKPS